MLVIVCSSLINTVEGQKDGVTENYKADSQFSSHLKKLEGVSNFAKSRTLKEQREYLPAFAVREELMGMIRDHQGMLYLITCIVISNPY